MVGCLAWAFRCAQRASGGTQETERAQYSSGSGVGALDPLRVQAGVHLLEGVGDVFEEDEAQDHVLVFGGVHAAPQSIDHLPELRLVAHGSAVNRLLPSRRLAGTPSRAASTLGRYLGWGQGGVGH
jgi:hypothetical protein